MALFLRGTYFLVEVARLVFPLVFRYGLRSGMTSVSLSGSF